jgi:hypothetical protein
LASPAAIPGANLALDLVRARSPRKFGRRSREWFWRVRTAELVSHCGGHPTPTQTALIERFVSLEWELRRRIAAGDLTFAERLEAEKALRRDLRELGLRPAAEPSSSAPASRALSFREFMGRARNGQA